MTAIRSLADELREKMRQPAGCPEPDKPVGEAAPEPERKTPAKKAGKPPPVPDELFAAIAAFELSGNEKLLIRLDSRTVFMLKQLKVTKGIDMNKLIAYSLEAFFKERPELIHFIKSSLQTIEL